MYATRTLPVLPFPARQCTTQGVPFSTSSLKYSTALESDSCDGGAWSDIWTWIEDSPDPSRNLPGRGSSVSVRMDLTPFSFSHLTWAAEDGKPEAATLRSITQLKLVGLSVNTALRRR